MDRVGLTCLLTTVAAILPVPVIDSKASCTASFASVASFASLAFPPPTAADPDRETSLLRSTLLVLFATKSPLEAGWQAAATAGETETELSEAPDDELVVVGGVADADVPCAETITGSVGDVVASTSKLPLIDAMVDMACFTLIDDAWAWIQACFRSIAAELRIAGSFWKHSSRKSRRAW